MLFQTDRAYAEVAVATPVVWGAAMSPRPTAGEVEERQFCHHTTCCTQRWRCCHSVDWNDSDFTRTGCEAVEGHLVCHHRLARMWPCCHPCWLKCQWCHPNQMRSRSSGDRFVTTLPVEGRPFVTTRLARRCGRVATPIGWSDSDVTPTSCGLGRAETVLSQPNLVHRGVRITATVVWMTVTLPLPARRRSQGDWGRQGSVVEHVRCPRRVLHARRWLALSLREGAVRQT